MKATDDDRPGDQQHHRQQDRGGKQQLGLAPLSPQRLRGVDPQPGDHQGEAIGVDPLLLLVLVAEQQRPRPVGGSGADQSKRLGLELDQPEVGIVGVLQLLGVDERCRQALGLLDRGVEVSHVGVVPVLPAAVTGDRRHARRHREHLVEVNDHPAELLDAEVLLLRVVGIPVRRRDVPAHAAGQHDREHQGDREQPLGEPRLRPHAEW
jgi:hypothetical protein